MLDTASPFFSVVIPIFNREHLIEDTLDSVFAQTFEDFEVIVVDDGSTDRTAAVVASYPEPVCLIRQDNAGPGAARNTGIEVARGSYVAFLDSDDRWFPWTLATYFEVVERYDTPALIGARTYVLDAVESALPDRSASLLVDNFNNFLEAAGEGRYISTNATAVKRSALEKAGRFTPLNINAEDHDLSFRLGNAPGFVQIQSPELVAIRRHEGQLTAQHRKTYEGLQYLIDQEMAGSYPGGEGKQRERRFLLCQHVRSASLALLREAYYREAIALYMRTFSWQLRFGRFRYLAGFPAMALSKVLGSNEIIRRFSL